MSSHFAPPIAVDLLDQALEFTRLRLDPSVPIASRVRILWAAARAARDLGASDVVQEAFTELATQTGLTRDLVPTFLVG